MTLQASGPISINDIATEFGLANNATFPSAFYGKGGAPASGALSLQDFYGLSNAPPPLDTQTLTTAVSGSIPNRLRGYIQSSFGSISPNTSAIYSATIIQMYHDESSGVVTVAISGTRANSGWTKITVDGSIDFTRASASFSQSGGNTFWQWVGSNPFGTSGTHSIVWS